MSPNASLPFVRHSIPTAEGFFSYLSSEPAGLPRLHFAHATGFNALTYRKFLTPMVEMFDVRAWDARGHGFTQLPSMPEEQTSWDRYAEDLEVFLTVWGDEPVLLCGHSMGATISLLLAARAPSQVAGLFLLDPPIFPRDLAPAVVESPMSIGARRRRAKFASREEMVAAYRGRGAFKTWPDDVLWDYVVGGTQNCDDGGVELTCTPGWEAATFSGQLHDTWKAIRSVQVPTLLLVAETQSPTRIGGMAELKQENPKFDVRTIPGGTHFFPMECPDRIRDELREFAAKLPL